MRDVHVGDAVGGRGAAKQQADGSLSIARTNVRVVVMVSRASLDSDESGLSYEVLCDLEFELRGAV